MKKIAYEIIVDDLLLYGRIAEKILAYIRKFLAVLKHHHATIKLKRCILFQDRCQFVGMDMSEGGI